MKLDQDINYIVSGLERSGTSLLMQILNSADIPCAFDQSRKPDINNPKGYYELEGGKIINKLMEKQFPFEKFKGRFIKITAYGIKFLPPGKYKILYSERDMEEIMDSMEKMAKTTDSDRKETKKAFTNLNKSIKNQIQEREDIQHIFINYNKILTDTEQEIKKIQKYLEIPSEKIKDMVGVVDKRLYRQRRTN